MLSQTALRVIYIAAAPPGVAVGAVVEEVTKWWERLVDCPVLQSHAASALSDEASESCGLERFNDMVRGVGPFSHTRCALGP